MITIKKKICKRGHDTSICGRDNNGGCKECRRMRVRKYEPGKRPKKRFCKRGHDTNIVGRGPNGGCKECHKELNRKSTAKGRPKQQFCINGHNTAICGRNKQNMCIQCKKDFGIKWAEEHQEELKQRREEHWEEILEYNRQWRQKHPEAVKAKTIKQATSRNLRIVVWTDWPTINKIVRKCPKNMTVDHHIPLQGDFVSGLHVSWNLQYLTPHDNFSKNNRCNLMEISAWYGKILKQAGLK